MRKILTYTSTLAACTLLLLCGSFPAEAARKKGSDTPQQPDSAAILSQRRDFETGKALETFFNIFRNVDLYYVDTVNASKMMTDAANGMLRQLDPYTEYLPADKMADFETMTTGKYAGLGSLIRESGEWVDIIEPYKDSPADKAGLRPGDRILAIDGEPMQGKEVTYVSNKLRGEINTQLELTYRPIADTTAIRTVTITRERISMPAVPYYGWLDASTGYISLDNFTENCAAEVRKALTDLQATGRLQRLVLDLRDNGGGIVGEGVKIVGLFVPRGTPVVEIKGRVAEINHVYRTTSEPVAPNLPLAVMINRASASTSEIVAGALQDLDRAVIIGQRSFGKGLVQTTRPVAEKESVKLTTAKYYTPSGRCIQAVDYSHRNEDGSVGYVPDSLIGSFRTAAGRTVYDGGGIMPDIVQEPEYLGKFTAILIGLGHMDNFANLYAARHPAPALTQEGTVPDFEVNDELYAEFCRYMEDKTLDFESGTEHQLGELRRLAETEKYADRISAELDAIAEKIKEDKEADLRDFAPEIKAELASMIVARWYYGAGRIEYGLRSDPEIAKAAEILHRSDEYLRILSEQDTQRK